MFGETTELCPEIFMKMTRFIPTPGATLQGTNPGIMPVSMMQIVEPMVMVCSEVNPKFDPTSITFSSSLAPSAGKLALAVGLSLAMS